jgi:hypothetical protein
MEASSKNLARQRGNYKQQFSDDQTHEEDDYTDSLSQFASEKEHNSRSVQVKEMVNTFSLRLNKPDVFYSGKSMNFRPLVPTSNRRNQQGNTQPRNLELNFTELTPQATTPSVLRRHLNRNNRSVSRGAGLQNTEVGFGQSEQYKTTKVPNGVVQEVPIEQLRQANAKNGNYEMMVYQKVYTSDKEIEKQAKEFRTGQGSNSLRMMEIGELLKFTREKSANRDNAPKLDIVSKRPKDTQKEREKSFTRNGLTSNALRSSG